MMLHHSFTGLKTKRIVFEDVFVAIDSECLEQLKDLSAKRRSVEESVNDISRVTEATAREISGGLASRNQQEIHKLEQYLPLLENFVVQVDSISALGWTNVWISKLKIRWSSILESSSTLKLQGPKYFQINSLKYELGMTLFLYGLSLREGAIGILEDLQQSASLLKQAAGVFNHLNTEVLLSLQHVSPKKPPEVAKNVCSAMSLLCLAEAQAVSIKMAEKKNMSSSLLAKLHYGVTQLVDEASAFLPAKSGGISGKFLDFIHACRNIHELRSQRHLAESYKEAKQMGVAIGLLNRALKHKINTHGNPSWRTVYRNEVNEMTEMLTKYKKENSFVWGDQIPLDFELPALEGKKIVIATPYEPSGRETKLVFKAVL